MKTITDSTPNLNSGENHAPINLDGFLEAACGEESERIELIQMYAGQLSLRLPQAQAAFKKKELKEVARILHSLTGATFTCGLAEFGTTLRSLEEAAKIADADAVAALFPQALDYSHRLETAIATELARCRS